MGTYSIKDLEQLSGIKAHTLRMWEQRYGIINPQRTETNIRYYGDQELRKLLNIAYLNQNGYKISKLAEFSADQAAEMVAQISDSNLEFPNQVNAMVIAMVNLDEERFEKIIATNTLQFGFERTMINIVYPFLIKIGVLWQTGSINPAHEHFISNLIRQKIIVAIDGQVTPLSPQAKRFALFLPEGELHELTLLFATYVLKSRHNKAIYLGQSLPLRDLVSVYDTFRPDYFLTVISSYPVKNELIKLIHEMVAMFPGVKILLSGYQVIKVKDKLPPEVIVFEHLDDLIRFTDANSINPYTAPYTINRSSR